MISPSIFDYLVQELKNVGAVKANGKLNNRVLSVLKKHPGLYNSIVEATSFLEYPTSPIVKLHVLLQNIVEQPKCKQCGTYVKMAISGRYRYKFPQFCSPQCMVKHQPIREKRTITNIKKYGCKNPMSNTTVRNKAKQTCIDKYGSDNPMRVDDIKERVKRTKKQRHGHDGFNNSDKRKQTCIDRYGTDNPFKISNTQKK